jgi:hypothetical protein
MLVHGALPQRISQNGGRVASFRLLGAGGRTRLQSLASLFLHAIVLSPCSSASSARLTCAQACSGSAGSPDHWAWEVKSRTSSRRDLCPALLASSRRVLVSPHLFLFDVRIQIRPSCSSSDSKRLFPRVDHALYCPAGFELPSKWLHSLRELLTLLVTSSIPHHTGLQSHDYTTRITNETSFHAQTSVLGMSSWRSLAT